MLILNVLDFVSSSSKSVNSINVIPIDTPSTYISGQKGTYIFSLAYPDGVILDTSEIEKLLPDLNVTLQNSVPVQTTLATYNNELVVNFTFTGYGFYTLTFIEFTDFDDEETKSRTFVAETGVGSFNFEDARI